jgi:mono/diheme cytochrome c family protein
MWRRASAAEKQIERKGKAMKEDNAERHVIFAFLVLLLFFVGLTFFVVSIARADSGQNNADSASTFRAKCVVCHGQDGGGSQVGKTLNVPDLRSPEVQKQTDAELAQIISDGRGGMPSFKSSLSDDQIHGLVTHIRSLAAKK